MGTIIKNSSIFPLFEKYPNMCVTQTVSSLLKTLLETVMDVRSESVIILKSSVLDDIDGVLTRLSYSNSKIYTFANNDKYNNFSILNQQNNVFEEDFLLIFSERFSVAMAWAPTDTKGFLNACVTLNSAIINNIYEIMKAKADYREVTASIGAFNLDRRGNIMFDTILNKLLLKVEDYQRDLICANSELDETNILEEKDMRNILKNFSHELRNPVGMLGLYSKILSGHAGKIKHLLPAENSVKELEKASDVINTTVEHIENTLSEMSNYTREFRLNVSNENINTLIKNTVEFALPSFKNKGVELIFVENADNLTVKIDKHKIYQVLLNLLKNALEVTGQGKKVTVTLDNIDNEIVLKIKDEGAGISKDILPKIFRAYFSTKENGSGIGLTLSKQIIEKHGGELTLISNGSDGCEFQINLIM